MCGKLLTQTEAITGRRILLGQAGQRRGDETDLFYIGTAVDAGREVQADPKFGQYGNVVVQILRGSIRDIAASQATVDPY